MSPSRGLKDQSGHNGRHGVSFNMGVHQHMMMGAVVSTHLSFMFYFHELS